MAADVYFTREFGNPKAPICTICGRRRWTMTTASGTWLFCRVCDPEAPDNLERTSA